MLKNYHNNNLYFFIAFNANAGSDGELALKKDQATRNKRLF